MRIFVRSIRHKTIKKNAMKIENIEIKRTSSYGRYMVTGIVNGIEVRAITTDSETFDYLNDEDNEYKNAMAIAHCECKLIEAYENI